MTRPEPKFEHDQTARIRHHDRFHPEEDTSHTLVCVVESWWEEDEKGWTYSTFALDDGRYLTVDEKELEPLR